MKPLDQRIAIAEACGWTHIKDFNTMAAGGIWLGYPPTGAIIGKHHHVPDYLNDLNAMHEAEKSLSNDDWDDKFYHWIGFVVSGGQEATGLWEYRKMVVHATAAQRAEAFLRTIGKWIDND